MLIQAIKGDRRREKGEREIIKLFLSSGLRSAVCVLLFFLVVSLSAVDINKPVVGISSGVTIDIAPFGIEQIYITAQGLYTFPGTFAFSFRPSISIADSSKMLRIPLVLNLSVYADKNEFIVLSGYFGGGMEVYRSTAHNTYSLLLTGGFTIAAGSFFIDIPVVRAYRSYNTDSDIVLTAGFYFQR